MPPKLTAQERLKLIKRVVEGREKVTAVCREAGISRILFYRWLARYKKLGVGVLGKLGKRVKPRELSPRERLRVIEKVKAGEEVAKVCREASISRTIFYRWLKRYEQAPEGQKLEALWDRKPQVSKYYQQTPEDVEGAVLSVVTHHPELSSHKIVEFLPWVGNKPILGNHGVQNVLRRHSLNTYEQRLVYSLTHRHAPKSIAQFIHAFQNLFSGLYSLSALRRQLVVRFATSFALGIFTFIVLFGARGYLLLLASAPTQNKIGFLFATLALSMGMIFFLYSLKYYFTLTIILGFSRQITGGKNDRELISSRPWWQKIFKSPVSLELDIANEEGDKSDRYGGRGIYLGGLQSDLSQVVLQRKPFVSIHLALYNEKRVADRLLTACTSMEYENYEVVIVDDSTDETAEILKRWENHPRVKVIHRESREGYKGGALREALKVSSPKTEFILVFDADFLPYPDTITQFLKYFQATAGGLDFGKGYRVQGIGSREEKENSKPYTLNPNPSPIAAVQGYQWHVLNKSENWVTRGVRSEYAGSYVVERSGAEAMGALKQIAGSVYMIRRDVLEKYGWGTSITEDFELTLRLYRDGYKVVYTPYIQTPSECVSTLKRLIRQRMRWAEGHSHNIKRMFLQLMFGRWASVEQTDSEGGKCLISNYSNYSNQIPNPNDQNSLGQLEIRSIRNLEKTSKEKGRVWIPSKLTLMEKLEFLYLSPYYLQAALFLIGTFSWFLAEAVFQVRLPFWTALWGWSLILTNLCALPLVNTVGLFLEESEERDYLGILSFIVLSYLLAPFQAYAAVKGFLESQEGPWFRTPKTGKITDIFTPGRFARFISGIFGRPAFAFLDPKPYTLNPNINPYLSLVTANNRFENFRIKPKRIKWLGRTFLVSLLLFSTTILSLAPAAPYFIEPKQVKAQEFGMLTSTPTSPEVTPTPTVTPSPKSPTITPYKTPTPALTPAPTPASAPWPTLPTASFKNLGLTRHDFKAGEEVRVNLGSDKASSFEISVKDSGENEVKFSLSDEKAGKENLLKIAHGANFRPGKYTLKMRRKATGEETVKDFTWGVLAINTSKSIYLPDEEAYIQMAALKDDGHTLCDADLELKVTSPGGFVSQPNVLKSGKCGPDNVTDVPDYFAYYRPWEIGVYQIKLVNKSNQYSIDDSFEVRESVPFSVERIGPTRIYPYVPYEMKLKVTAYQKIKGYLSETIPSEFIVLSNVRQSDQGKEKVLSWPIDWEAGEKEEFTYRFDAPDVSPEFYLLGPGRIIEGGGREAFREKRQWQIAADADVTVDAAAILGTSRGMRNTVFTSSLVGYHFFIDADSDLSYVKTTNGGSSWGGLTDIKSTETIVAYDVWYDRWTSGDTGSLIHIWYAGTGADDVIHETFDTTNDSQSGEHVVFTGVTAAAARAAFISGAKARGGNLLVAYTIDSAAECGMSRSIDGGTNWGSRTNMLEACGDQLLMFPGNEADNQDMWALYDDISAEQLTLKMHDDSANSNSESTTTIPFTDNTTDGTGQYGFTGTIRFSDGHLLAATFSQYDMTTADFQTWDINGTGSITEKTAISTDKDDQYYPSIYIDQGTDTVRVAYIGKRDGLETLGTTNGVYYTTSTDNMANWSAGDTAYSATASDWRNTWAPIMGRRFLVVWRDLSSQALLTNFDNSIAAPLIIGGTVYGTDESTVVTSGPTVRIKVDGSGTYSATANGSGVYSIGGVTAAAGTSLTIYLDTDGGITGSTFTRSTGEDMSNIHIYQDRATTRCDNSACSLTNADINDWDKTNDTDIHAASDGTDLTVDNDWKLLIAADTFAPGGTVTTSSGGGSSYSGDIEIKSGTTLNMNGNNLSVGGVGATTARPLLVGGTYTTGSNTTTFTGGSSSDLQNATYYNLTINGTGPFNGMGTTTVSNELLISSGTLAMGSYNLTVGSTAVSNSGSIKVASGTTLSQSLSAVTTVLGSASGSNCIGSSGASCAGTAGTIGFGSLTIGNASTSFTTTLVGNIQTDNVLNITTNATLNASSYQITLTGKGTAPLVKNGTFTASSSTVVYTGANTIFTKRQPVTITNNTAGVLTDFPVKLTVSYDADMQTDFDDLRFFNSSGVPLDYWLETKTDSTSATIWVEVDSIPASDSTTIYMNYGNASLSSASNGDNTFTFFDDFDDNSIDSAKWTTVSGGGGSIAETNQEIQVTSDGTNRIYLRSLSTYSAPFVWESRGKKSENVEFALHWNGTVGTSVDRIQTGYYAPVYASWEGPTVFRCQDWTNSVETACAGASPYSITLDTNYHDYRIVAKTTGIDMYYDGTSIITSTDTTRTSGYIAVSARETPAALNSYYDNVRIRKYASSDPSTAFGSEETAPTTISSTSITYYNLTINGLGVTFNLGGATTVSYDLTITAGTLDVTTSNYALNVARNWSNSGAFTARSGTVTLNATDADSDQQITGSTTFYNLTATSTVNRYLTFASGSTTTIAAGGTFTATGTSCGALLYLRDSGSTWNLTFTDVTPLYSTNYVHVTNSNSNRALTAANGTDGGGNTNWTFTASCGMSSANVTAWSFQRKTFYDGTDKVYWRFYYDGTQIGIDYNSQPWTSSWTATTALAENTNDFSLWDDDTTVYMAYYDTNDIRVRKGTLNASSITWDTTTSGACTSGECVALDGTGASDTYQYTYVTRDSSGYIWVVGRFYNGTNYYMKARRTSAADDLTAWGTASDLSLTSNTDSNVYGSLSSLGSQDMYAVWIRATAIEGKKWTNGSSSWDVSATSIATGKSGLSSNISMSSDTSNNLHLAYIDSGDDVYYKKYNGTSWDVSATTIDSVGISTYTAVSVDISNNDIYVLYLRSGTAYYNKYSGSWGGATDTNWTEGTSPAHLTSNYADSGLIFAEWTSGSVSPYTLNWNYIIIPEKIWLLLGLGLVIPWWLRKTRLHKSYGEVGGQGRN